MRVSFALALLLTCAACSQEDAPADDIAEAAEEVVAPAAEPVPVAKGKWAPRDECGGLEGADEFRERLAAAVKARDAEALVALAAGDVMLDFGGSTGHAELRKRLADAEWELWDELDMLMTLGCAANDEGGITTPWYFEQDLGGDDPFAAMLVAGENVPVFQRPDPASKRLTTVSWDLVEFTPHDPEEAAEAGNASAEPRERYDEVELSDGTTGFIARSKLRELTAYRLLASSRNGRWRITMFLGGD